MRIIGNFHLFNNIEKDRAVWELWHHLGKDGFGRHENSWAEFLKEISSDGEKQKWLKKIDFINYSRRFFRGATGDVSRVPLRKNKQNAIESQLLVNYLRATCFFK